MQSFYLEPQYSTQKSFYNKARVEVSKNRDERIFLFSYKTLVASAFNGELKKHWNWYSRTTMKHISEFARQFASYDHDLNKKEWDNLPYEDIGKLYSNLCFRELKKPHTKPVQNPHGLPLE